MLKIDNLPVEPPDIFPFSYDEVLKIVDCLDPFYRPYVVARFFSGLRAGEIDALEWSDFKPEMKPNPKLHINKAYVYGQVGKTKIKKSKRYVDCIEPVLEAMMMLSSGEDIGWVQNMLGHSSLQMIFTRYYSWIPRATRRDGSAFMKSVCEKGEASRPEKPRGGGKVIPLFGENDTKTTQATKRAHGDVP